jgi:autotransporter passenger strand-loop-strand repeat protein
VLSAGAETVFGSAVSAIVAARGILNVSSGGLTIGATVSSSGNLFVSGSGSATTVSAGGADYVFSGGIDSATSVYGAEVVSAGGVASGMILSSGGGAFVYGSAVSASVQSSAFLNISSGGVASATTVSSGGVAFVYGSASGTTLMSGGKEFISSGGIDNGTTLSGGKEVVIAGGTLSGIVTFAGSGQLVLDQSASFSSSAMLAGFNTTSDLLDLADISFASHPTIGYTPASGNLSGTLSVSDGVHSANLVLIGQYTAGSFSSSADATGGTIIVDPPASGTQQLTNPHA